jgi:CheY-like chemotaxis protein
VNAESVNIRNPFADLQWEAAVYPAERAAAFGHYQNLSKPPFPGKLKMIDTASKDNTGDMGLPTADIADMICDRQSRKGSVLVANGDKKVRKKLSAILVRMGYDVVVSSNGEDAFDQFLKGFFDIAFTTLKMPGMDGLTLSLQIKAASLYTSVVMILDEHMESIMNRIKAGRIDGVMFKPLRSEEVQKMLQYVIKTNYKK